MTHYREPGRGCCRVLPVRTGSVEPRLGTTGRTALLERALASQVPQGAAKP